MSALNALVTTNGGGGGGGVNAVVPPSPTSNAPTQENNSSASTHTKNTAALCRYTLGEIPPPLIGSTSSCIPPYHPLTFDVANEY